MRPAALTLFPLSSVAGGRLAWAAFSDVYGRRTTFHIFTLGSIPLFLSVPFLVDAAITSGSVYPLYGFCAVTAVAVSIFGGIYAVMPAYEADLYGAKNVAPIHGRVLMFSSTAAVLGPYTLLKLRAISERTAIDGLLAKVPHGIRTVHLPRNVLSRSLCECRCHRISSRRCSALPSRSK